MLPIMLEQGEDGSLPRVKDCTVGEHFGAAREWLIYECQAYFI